MSVKSLEIKEQILYNIFTNCPNLTNDSLNNIMLMCANATRVTNKSFLNIGLTENQINICKTLDNYTLATSAGWRQNQTYIYETY